MLRRPLLLLTWILLAAPAQAQSFTARVVAIRDADTVVILRDNRSVRIRLYGIDTPEMKQPFGVEAHQFTSDLTLGKTVTVHQKEIDRLDRIVAEVILPDGSSLNAALVSAGLAWWYREGAPEEARLRQLEREARAARRGLWSDPNRIAPWDWRNGYRVEGLDDAGRPPGLRYDPDGPDRDCSDFRSQTEAQVFFVAAGGPSTDPHGLDEDGNGTACEELME